MRVRRLMREGRREAMMKAEAAAAGFSDSPWSKHPRLQILTVAELLQGNRIDYPASRHLNVTFRKAPKAQGKVPEDGQLPIG